MSKFTYTTKKNPTPAMALALFLGALLGGLVFFLLTGWVTMLIIGAVHAQAFLALPAISYVGTLWTLWLTGLVGTAFNASLSAKVGKTK